MLIATGQPKNAPAKPTETYQKTNKQCKKYVLIAILKSEMHKQVKEVPKPEQIL